MFNDKQPEFIALRDIVAEDTSQLVIWVGTGLSAPAGMPTWRKLKEILEKDASQKANTFDEAGKACLREKIRVSRSIHDIWNSFDILAEALGETVYHDMIDKILTPSKGQEVPEGYRYVWRLNPKGVITLNIDGFAARSFILEKQNEALNQLTGKEARTRLNILSSPLHFAVNLHGIHGDYKSWVFKRSDLAPLIKDWRYKRFLDNVFSAFRVLFIGISADDEAVGGFINNLLSQGIELSSHFWVTDRQDLETEKWAQRNNIQIIRYKADIKHTELKQFFDIICGYLPKEKVSPPVHPTIIEEDLSLPEPEEIAKMEPETIRKILNSYAAEILKNNTKESYKEYNAFRDKYAKAIHIVDFVKPKTEDNVIFGYSLIEEIGSGGFSTVYRAEKDGGIFAVKKLHKERMGIPGILQCFRRGVESMRILTEESVDGVVPYKEAYEIPPCLVMDLINGPDLRTAVEQNRLSFEDKLRIALDAAKIIRKGHELDKIVLHRDIRPANIMLENYYDKREDFKVVILDFDLSWHKGAVGESIRPENLGWKNYHAPEQTGEIEGVSTRQAKVDSFGFGMTLFFLFSGKEPYFDKYAREDYYGYLKNLCSSIKYKDWESFTLRIARLIYNATKYAQKERWSMAEIQSELQRICNIIDKPSKYRYVDFYAEEILHRSLREKDYEWNNKKLSGEIMLQSGFHIKLKADEVEEKVKLIIHWVSKGQEAKKSIEKFFQRKTGLIIDTLKKGGWTKESFACNKARFDTVHYIKMSNLLGSIDRAEESLRKCIDTLHFA